MNRPHPNPRLAALGRTIGVAEPSRLGPPTLQETTRKPLIDELIEGREISFGFDSIDAPISTGAAAASLIQVAQWVRLGTINTDLLNQDVFVNKIVVTQLSADVPGTAAGFTTNATPLAWGNKYGTAAGIVVGSKLMEGRTSYRTSATYAPWFLAPCNLPGLFQGNAATIPQGWGGDVSGHQFREATDNIVDSRVPNTRYMASFDWTIGSLADTQPFKQERVRSFGILGKRIGRKENLEVYLVLKPQTHLFAEKKVLFGYCKIDFTLGLTRESGTNRE